MRSAFTALLAALLVLQPAAAAPPPGAAGLAAGTTLRTPALSPDATRVALLASHAGGEAVLVRTLDGGATRPVYRFDAAELAVTGLSWLDAKRLLLRVTASGRDSHREAVHTQGLLIVDADSGELTALYNGPGVHVNWSNERARLVEQPRPAADSLMLVHQESGGGVVRIDTRSTLRTRVQRPIEQAIAYWADGSGELRVAVRREFSHVEMLGREADGRGWKLLKRWPVAQRQEDEIWLLGFENAEHKQHFLLRGSHEGRPAVLRMDLSQSEAASQLVSTDPAVTGARELLRNAKTGAAIGVIGADGNHYWAEQLAELQAGLAAALPGRSPRLLQWLGDDYLVSTGGAATPEQFWHGRRSMGALSPLLSARPTLPAELPLRSETLNLGGARVALLRPAGNDKLPVIWCLQCGLQASEMNGERFNPLAAFLATRGWAVLQPLDLNDASAGGRTLMQRAQARDAKLRPLLSLALQQPALGLDDKRVALMGFNLLGFDALRWAAEEPQRFRAVIVLDAMTDLRRYAAMDREPFGDTFRSEVRSALADLDGDAQRAASPLSHAEKLPGALLLVHGERSDRVDAEHARSLAEARKAAGLPVELLLLKDSSSEVRHARYREQVMTAAEALLRQAFSSAN